MNIKPKNKKWMARIFGFAVGGGILLTASITLKSHWFDLKPIKISLDPSSHQEVLFQRIKQDLEKEFKNGENKKIWQISIRDILKVTKKDNRIQQAYITRYLLEGISVRIRPRDPVLGLLDPKGKVHPISSDASLLPPLPPQEAPDLPYLWGKEFFDDENRRAQAISLIEQIPAEGAVSRASISEIHFIPEQGFALVLVGKGIHILLGEGEFKSKVNRVDQVLHYLNEHQIDGRVIDARFSKKVVVRLRNQS